MSKKVLAWAALSFIIMLGFTAYAFLVAVGLVRIYLEVFYALFMLTFLFGSLNLVLAFYYALKELSKP